MEIKINCLRNGIEGGGASNGPATLLDGYGTYLYDLYKPSDADVAAHPELADEPLGIVYPMGNTVFKVIKSITYSDYSDGAKEPIVKFVRSWFLPSLIREMNKNGDNFSPVSYLREYNPLSSTSSNRNDMWSYYYPVLDGKANDVTFSNIMAYPSLINNVSLVNAFKLSTDLWYSTTGVTKYGEWQDKTDDINDENRPKTILDTLFPIFAFYKPSYSTNSYIISQRPSENYKYMFSAEKLSEINEADIDYYKKSAVLIYKKDLMDFKNFFKKILVYGKEIYTYANSLRNPQS
ncbi:MAG: hypothetical protein MSG78_10985 [Clostridiales bacterium]|nr:hypothetical protein [Clostridiales bacterium]